MKRLMMMAACAGALTAAALGVAGTASAAGARADDIVNGLQAQGYSVQLNGAGSAPLSACTVSNVSGVSAAAPAAGANPTAVVDVACPTGC
jgi:ABC-type phosphate transport system substrate-binding protein